MNHPLENRIALVTGATRGAGRAIARSLGAAGATVYCTGRSVTGKPSTSGRPETINETATLVTSDGGTGIAVQVDHTKTDQVVALVERIKRDHGVVDILVNDVWGGDELSEWGKPFWEQSLEKGFLMLERAVHSHIITSRLVAPMMVERKRGLIVEVSDGHGVWYRDNFFYDLAKNSVLRIAFAMSMDLKPHGVTALALTPGFLRSEAVLDVLGVKEGNWRDGVAKDEHFAQSETPFYVGRAIAALAADPSVHTKAGRSLTSGALAREYGFHDVDGAQPDWPAYFRKKFPDLLARIPVIEE